jgi:DNA-binding transcriptional regulator YbjK
VTVGATRRGEQRRERLVAAAAELLLARGPDAVTARAVAGDARVPLGAVTYYFADVGELRRTAVARLLEQHLEGARARLAAVRRGASAAAVARHLVAVLLGPYAGAGAAGVRALYARALAAAGDPLLAGDLRRWDDALAGLVAELLEAAGRDPGRARAVLACADGFALAWALDGGPADGEARLGARLAGVLDLLAPRT